MSNINNYRELQYYFEKYFRKYQYVLAPLFVTFYVQNDAHIINIRGFYILHFKEWLEKKNKKKEPAEKNAELYAERKEVKEYSQNL